MKKIIIYLLVNLVLYLSIETLYGQVLSSPIGGLAGSPMRMGFGARGIGMGNALTAVLSGQLDAYYNPASLPFVTSRTFNATYCILSLDRRLNFLSYTTNVKPNAGLSIAVINAGVSNIDGRNYDGLHTQVYSTSENSFMLSFGLKPDTSLSIGMTTKILYYSLFEGIKSTTLAVDFGSIILLKPELTIGIVIQDIGAKYKWDTSKLYGLRGNVIIDRFPLRKRIGIGWNSNKLNFILSGELEFIGKLRCVRFGTEISPVKGLSIRGGVDQITLNSDVQVKPSMGFAFEKTFSKWATVFHYAYVFEPYSLSGINVLTLSIELK